MSELKGETRFESNGKAYILKFTFNAMCDVEDAFHMSIQSVLDKLSRKEIDEGGNEVVDISLRDIRVMMRCGLNGGRVETNLDSEFTDKQAGEIVQGLGGFLKALDFVSTAFINGFSDGSENSKKEVKEPEAISQ